jgi:hypothetical protein
MPARFALIDNFRYFAAGPITGGGCAEQSGAVDINESSSTGWVAGGAPSKTSENARYLANL